jgi:hypothetical protein
MIVAMIKKSTACPDMINHFSLSHRHIQLQKPIVYTKCIYDLRVLIYNRTTFTDWSMKTLLK